MSPNPGNDHTDFAPNHPARAHSRLRSSTRQIHRAGNSGQRGDNIMAVTREQVVQWMKQVGFELWVQGLGKSNEGFITDIATLARADLEAIITKLKSSKRRMDQIERITALEATLTSLQSQVDFWVADRNELQVKDDALIAKMAGDYSKLEGVIAEQATEIARYKDIEQEMLMIGVERAKDQFQEQIDEQAKQIQELKRLDFRGMREMLRAMQAGELTVSRGIEILDMWHAGNWNNDMLPPVRQDLIEEDSMPVEIIDRLRLQLQASQAREAQLRDAFEMLCERTGYPKRLGECPEKHVLEEALAIPSDDTALREYGAKLVEKIASGNDLSMSLYLKAIARKIREGTF